MHFRGTQRLRLGRQIGDYSTILAPYNVLMYAFQAVPNKPVLSTKDFPELEPLRANWHSIRDEAVALFDEGHIRAAAGNTDWGFHSFFKSGWKRFYLKLRPQIRGCAEPPRGVLRHRRLKLHSRQARASMCALESADAAEFA